jgi:hypothetical protein
MDRESFITLAPAHMLGEEEKNQRIVRYSLLQQSLKDIIKKVLYDCTLREFSEAKSSLFFYILIVYSHLIDFKEKIIMRMVED